MWSPADYALAGALLLGAGLAYRSVAGRAGDGAYRLALGVAIATALLLVWLVGAVGLIGKEGDRADAMYAGVLAVALVGAVIARLRPAGMARALFATALAQALVTVIALVAGKQEAPASSVLEIVGVNAFFAALFVAAACLFGYAARRQPPARAQGHR